MTQEIPWKPRVCRTLQETVWREATRAPYGPGKRHSGHTESHNQPRAASARRRVLPEGSRKFVSWLRTKITTQNLEFKTHQPRLYGKKVEKHCVSCGRERPVKLWWQRKTATTEGTVDTEQFDCMTCFYNNAGDNLMPIGYEGLTYERPAVAKHHKR